ncbi:hypothetical protein BGX33_012492 [Mortierella sp. NVP41]|nr:hypothetical protein BGX33_012492 [Mortierella sp. NVP41]
MHRPHLSLELVRELSLYLDERDLCRAVCVNKDWRCTWTPYLWSNFTVIGADKSKAVDDRKYKCILARNAHLIRNVFVRCDSHVKARRALRKVPSLNLTSLRVVSTFNLESNVNRLVSITQKCSRL